MAWDIRTTFISICLLFFEGSLAKIITPSKWDYLGPFPIGKPEFDGDPIAGFGGIQSIPRPSKKKSGYNVHTTYPSMLSRNGQVGWQVLKTSKESNGVSYLTIPPSHQDVDWNQLVSKSGGTEILEFQGWAVTDLNIAHEGRYIIACSQINTIYIGKKIYFSNGDGGEKGRTKEVLVPLAGDQYNLGSIKAATNFPKGKTSLYIHVRGKVQTKFTCSLDGPFQSKKLVVGKYGNQSSLLENEIKVDGSVIPPNSNNIATTNFKKLEFSQLKVWHPAWYPHLVGTALMGGYISLPVFNPTDFDVELTQVKADITNDVLPPQTDGTFNDKIIKDSLKFSRALSAVIVFDEMKHNSGTTTIKRTLSEEGSFLKVSPGQTAYIPVKLSLINDHTSVFDKCKPILFDLKLHTRILSEEVEGFENSSTEKEVITLSHLQLLCRKPSESFVFSFIDHDSTVSQAAAVAPTDYVSHALKNRQLKKKKKKSDDGTATATTDDSKNKKTDTSKSSAKTQKKKREYNDVSLPIILSLHGTGISPSSQADSYKRKDNNDAPDYTFGVDSFWICAPTRHGAHNWEHTGFLTALSSAQALQKITASFEGGWTNQKSREHATRTSSFSTSSDSIEDYENDKNTQTGQITSTNYSMMPIADSTRLFYHGHSMGGHGAWVLASLAPDKAIGVMSAAGWIAKETYGDSNTLWKHDIQKVKPRLRNILEQTVAEHQVNRMVTNMAGLNVVARAGAQDRSVPAQLVREMSMLLSKVGGKQRPPSGSTVSPQVSITYDELPDKEHWWWDTLTPNDGGVMNDLKLRKFYQKVKKLTKAAEEESCWVDKFDTRVETTDNVISHDLIGEEVNDNISRVNHPLLEQQATTKTARHQLLTLSQQHHPEIETVCLNPATCSGRWGVKPLQAVLPFQQPIKVTFLPFRCDNSKNIRSEEVDNNIVIEENYCWNLRTENAKRLEISISSPLLQKTKCKFGDNIVVKIDSSDVTFITDVNNSFSISKTLAKEEKKSESVSYHVCHYEGKGWKQCEQTDAPSHDEPMIDSVKVDVYPVVNDGIDHYERWERGALTLGPARQVSAKPFMIVTGNRHHHDHQYHYNELLYEVGVYIANLHAMAADTYAPIQRDIQLLDDQISKHESFNHTKFIAEIGRNLILIGSPTQNFLTYALHTGTRHSSLLEQQPYGNFRFADGVKSAVKWSEDGKFFKIDGLECLFDRPGTAVVYLAPWFDGIEDNQQTKSMSPDMHNSTEEANHIMNGGEPRLALVVAGVDVDGLLLASRLAQPTIPPMTRAPFTNLIPDWIVLSSESDAVGYDGVLAAGFWGNTWEFDSRLSYINC